jgi:thiamine pyrophosphate-dependent acetolactate synthase large subunit-like protein
MSTSELKSNLHLLIDQIDDSSILKAVYKLLSEKGSGNQKDWWDELSENHKGLIEQGLKELDEGKGVPHEEVMRNARKILDKNE